jgi:broad specificity phosphatase PhoE
VSLRELYIFRHGETDWNVEKRWQGHTDISLNARGREQARELAELLAPSRIEAILTSDLKRASDTARAVAARREIPVFETPLLREASVGVAEGRTALDVQKIYGADLWRRWLSAHPDDLDTRYPGGESKREQLARAKKAVEDFIDEHNYQRIGVSTHGGAVRRLVHMALPADAAAVPLPNCVVYKMSYDSSSRLWSFEGALKANNDAQEGPFSE